MNRLTLVSALRRTASAFRRLAPVSPLVTLGFGGLLALGGCHYEGDAQYATTDWDYAGQPSGVQPAQPMQPVQPVAVEQPAQVQAGIDPNDADDEDAAALGTFKSTLDPYGTWVDDPTYGTVWTPGPTSVGADFSPYLTNGHWAYTSEGYYWVSDYQWGWATFHYGRWVWTDGYGWAWIPGARYAPAWVDWRYSNGYMGWGPRHPHYCFRNGGVVYIGYGVTPYVFVSSNHFFYNNLHTHVVGPAYHPTLVASSVPYTPPPRPLGGAHPFVGPDPKVAGIPNDHLAKATITPPSNAKPSNIAWAPHPVSKIAPAPVSKPGVAAGPPTLKPGGVAPNPGVAGPKPYNPPTASPPVYGPKPYNPPVYGPKPYNPPTASPPVYGPKPYNPPPVYKPAPTPYSPPPVYKPAPTPYSPPPVYHPSPAPVYKPSPAPAPHPPTYAPKPSYKPSPGGGKKK